MKNNARVISDTNGAEIEDLDYYAAAAVSAGDWVMVDVGVATTITPLGGACKTSTATNDLAMVLGVAPLAIAAGAWGKIRTYGPVSAKCDATVNAAGLALCTVNTAGTAKAAANTDINKVGSSLAAVSGGYATVFVGK